LVRERGFGRVFECIEDIRTGLLYDRHTGPIVPSREHSVIVPASVQGIRQAEAELAAFATASALPQDALWRFRVALDELISNVARHGASGADVGLEFRLEGGVLEVTVTDDAPAFNPLDVPPPDVPAGIETRPLGGVGIALVKGLMDELRYERREGRNRLTLRRTLED
jgi:serine/threonine-protein kinase RsbW